MNLVMQALVAGIWLSVAQATPTPAQETWLKGLEGAWIVDGAAGSEAEIVLNVSREGAAIVLRVVLRDRETVTRYDLSGAETTNRNATFRTRIDGNKLVTAIWDTSDTSGSPARIETRYLDSADRMVTELAKTPGGQTFNRTVLRRKGT